MSALFQPSLKARLLAAAFACFLAVGTLTSAAAAQAETPNLGASRATEVLPSAAPYAQTANVGNPAPATGAEKRVALVIGNSAYENVTPLPNPANDARAIGQFLNSAGFEVILATDLDHDEMIQVLQDFSGKIAERGPDTVAFVYYAGHGLQIAGDNYLVPVDAKISSEADASGRRDGDVAGGAEPHAHGRARRLPQQSVLAAQGHRSRPCHRRCAEWLYRRLFHRARH
jgi:hypothetical protein